MQDVRFLLEYNSIKLLVVITNKGKLSYLVKTSKYNKNNLIKLFNKSVLEYNNAKNIKDRLSASKMFLKKCKVSGLTYVECKGE